MTEETFLSTLIAYLFAEDLQQHPMPPHRAAMLLRSLQQISDNNIDTPQKEGSP